MKENQIIHGFTVQSVRPLPELEAQMFQMEHEMSGARLVWLDRKEENKTFAIAFRTLPEDDTGVFHILEHSVLCGSDRYPVKEPFVELMKSSLQTFLNAFTFPDKTMYPVCSRNDKDFANLVRVYMDAVLHPAIYHKPEIFRQEGWHYELKPEQAGPTYKGVVFNEMKGAYAGPDARLCHELDRQLFPDTSYRFESGGHPAHIPELTYEQFLDAHRRFYAPSNSYIYLDGQMNLDEILSILDGEFLKDFDRRDDQPQFVRQAPVKSGLTRAYYEISPDEPREGKARLAWDCVVGEITACREEGMALHALADALCGGSEAPLKRRLLSEGLAQDVIMDGIPAVFQTYVMLEAVNMDENRVDEVENAIREELERLVREGLDHEQLSATLANLEFQQRERDYGRMPQGLGMGLDVMASWLYGGDPAANLEVGELFASLNKKLEEGWFEELLERVFLKNDHLCRVLLIPSATLGDEERSEEAARLKAAQASWTEADEAELRAQQAALDAWQTSEDTPEALAKLPALRLSDIPAKPEDIPTEEGKLGGVPALRHALPTGGIGYVNLYFDAGDLTGEQLSRASLLCALLGELNTAHYTGAQLQKLQRSLTGSLSFKAEDPYGNIHRPEDWRMFLCVSFSAVEAKLEKAAALVSEILTGTLFDDHRRIRELLRQCAIQAEQTVSEAGHICAITRVSAGQWVGGAVAEHTRGVSYCRWLKETEKAFEERGAALAEELKALCAKLFTTGRLTVSVTGAEDAACAALEKALLAALPRSERVELLCGVKPWGVRREGIVIPSDVSYAALGGDLVTPEAPYAGDLQVMGQALSLAYLWNAVRVQGGAYGVGLNIGDTGSACFWSFRDPGAARSLGCYRQAADFLEQFAAAQPDLTGMITGTVAKSDPLLLPGKKGKAADGLFFKGVTYADRCQRREEVLAAAPEKLAERAEALRKLGESGGVCVIGSRKLVDACGGELERIVTL